MIRIVLFPGSVSAIWAAGTSPESGYFQAPVQGRIELAVVGFSAGWGFAIGDPPKDVLRQAIDIS